MIGRLWDPIRRRLFANPSNLLRRIMLVVFVLSAALSLGGLLALARLNVPTGTSSLPYLRPVLELVTSVWFYVVLLVVMLRRVLFRLGTQYARQAADVTGYDLETVKRERYETSSPEGSTRVLVTDEDDLEEIESRIDRALETGEDDTLSLNVDAIEPPDRSDEERTSSSSRSLRGRLRGTLSAAVSADPISWTVAGLWVLTAVAYLLASRAYGSLLGAPDSSAGALLLVLVPPILWLLRAGIWRTVSRVGRFLFPTKRSVVGGALLVVAIVAWHLAVTYGPSVATIGLTRGELELARTPYAYAAVGAAVLAAYVLTGSRSPGDRSDDDWLEDYKLARLDLATTLDFEEVAWTLVLPAAATVGLLLLAVQIWVPPWFYPPILATGLLVGILNYARVNWSRSRRLSSLRADKDVVEFAELSLLVKEVELPERTTYVAFLAERRYAHDDREEFVEGVASRAYEVVNGVPVSPSIMEKQADQLESYKPDLHGFRENEKYRIMRWLLDRVSSSRHGLIPKAALIEECVEHDLNVRGVGPLSREFGKGYDPELVREAYRELVPVALVEEEIDVEDEDASITAVRIRDDPLPPEYAEIRAQFSAQFGGYARADPMYRLPDVDDKLDEAPIFARGAEGAGA